ncbi:hypothetical protein [Methanococcus voltae]|uniref:Segregation and condensation protein B n=2 Tax=Methanococcus voltae TaxID=2188 RepID=A0A8J7RNG5_METVO|nr:hypothetical protein [Methanococcus voltae]MBP2172674.1 segregation and condensation protein B [Methanococcus voltae]MBP2201409.1 segregation and condensation protein B [Methanococcus voltae]MCS3922204.1 segregation and condensation protein B [Methanococcus voltae PS]
MLAITKMYQELMDLIGVDDDDYELINPYKKDSDLKHVSDYYDYIIISKGYTKRVSNNTGANPDKIVEVSAVTIGSLINTLNDLKQLKIGNCQKIDESVNQLSEMNTQIHSDNEIKELVDNFNSKNIIITNTSFIQKILDDLGLNNCKVNLEMIDEICRAGCLINLGSNTMDDLQKLVIVPDYDLDKIDDLNLKDKFDSNLCILKTHDYDLELIERIENRYNQILEFIK